MCKCHCNLFASFLERYDSKAYIVIVATSPITHLYVLMYARHVRSSSSISFAPTITSNCQLLAHVG